MVNYQKRYEKMTASLPCRPLAVAFLRFFNRMMTLVMPLVYLSLLWRVGVGARQFWLYLFHPALGLVLLSAVRKWINQPRPYETWDISPLLEKESLGNSMPSRHVFSAVLISMLCLSLWLEGGVALLFLSAFLACVRVFGGVHYPKDVFVGYSCGLLWGSLFYLCQLLV